MSLRDCEVSKRQGMTTHARKSQQERTLGTCIICFTKLGKAARRREGHAIMFARDQHKRAEREEKSNAVLRLSKAVPLTGWLLPLPGWTFLTHSTASHPAGWAPLTRGLCPTPNTPILSPCSMSPAMVARFGSQSWRGSRRPDFCEPTPVLTNWGPQ